MKNDPNRRSFLKEVGAATVAGSVATPQTLAGAAKASPVGSPYAHATVLIAALADKTVSSRELVDDAIARIEALDPKINAVVVRDFTVAREAAKTADEALARGERRPLLGLPMTVKEGFYVAGLPTTWGDPKFKDWRPAEDALAVARLKGSRRNDSARPTCRCSWPIGRATTRSTARPIRPGTPRAPQAGSSGGAAAALAAGFSAAPQLGSDIGGSSRAPAHYCGVFAHKPSLDLVPMRGGGPPGTPALPMRVDLAVAGPMARSAADLALELEVLAGLDELSDGIGYKF